tara:strand:+ start:457 stop:921 length:465 start_codon:yes stop_codon:yes gene_type:complete
MKKFLLITTLFIFISNCTLNKVEKHHGVYNLKKKSIKLELFQTNTNDTISKLGIPSTKSSFDNDVWVYIERKITSSNLSSLGKQKLLINDVLVLEFDNKGVLVEKKILSKNDMNKLDISLDKTLVLNKKEAFVSTFLTSLRKKINDPLGIKKAK